MLVFPKQERVMDEAHALEACLAACHACLVACLRCAEHSMEAGEDRGGMKRCIRLCLDCAAFCQLTIVFMGRRSELIDFVCEDCAEICELCAEECGDHESEACRACAVACQRCVEACRVMTAEAE